MTPALSSEDLPFEPAARPPVELTLRQYASFVVDCGRPIRNACGARTALRTRPRRAAWQHTGGGASKRALPKREDLERLAAAYRRWLDGEKQ